MSNGETKEKSDRGATPDKPEPAAPGPENDKPLIFISHKHDDAELAKLLRVWITEVTGGHTRVFSSADPEAERPFIGEDLDKELGKNLWQAGIVLLLYTYEDRDWAYCAWECGVALNPEEDDTRIVFLQCLDKPPPIQEHRVRVVVGDEQSMIDFAKKFGELDFYPGRKEPLSGMSESTLTEKGRQLHKTLVDELPSDPLENWAAWPYLRLEVPLAQVRELEEVEDPALRVEKCKEILESSIQVKEASSSACNLFGKSGLPAEAAFSTLIGSWRERSPGGSEDWLYTLSQQLVDGLRQDTPQIREWSRFRQVDGNGEHVIAVGRIKRRVANLVFDCYVCRIVDVDLVSSVMNKTQHMYYKDLESIEPSEIKLADLLRDMDDQNRSRLPILEAGAARLMVHASMIDRFIRMRAFEGADVQALTLHDLCQDEAMHRIFSESYIFVDASTTAHAAAKRLNEATGCQDIFVTESGSADEAVLGWICDRDLIDLN